MQCSRVSSLLGLGKHHRDVIKATVHTEKKKKKCKILGLTKKKSPKTPLQLLYTNREKIYANKLHIKQFSIN